jgi:predicted lysophospholipase L1 biosynthesis ABC-type transport system permease subunit
MKLSMYLNYSLRSLLRGGQRTILAIFCIAVGVMAIVAMQLVGLMIITAYIGDPRDVNGGDIAVYSSNSPFSQQDLSFFEQLKSDGTIVNYTASYNFYGSLPLTGKAHRSFSIEAVDPHNFPVVTPPTFLNPKDGSVPRLLKNNQGIVTAAFLEQYKKNIGDTVMLPVSSLSKLGFPLHIRIAGVVDEQGIFAQSGASMLISLDTFKQSQQNNPQTFNTIYVTTVNQLRTNQAASSIQHQFPFAETVTVADALKTQQSSADSIRKFLEFTGLVVLLIGGIGIAITMQVLLSRRTIEIAMLKTSGYSAYDLFMLFGLETGLLGLAGGLIGAAAGMGISYLVHNTIQQALALNIPFLLNPLIITDGVAIGLFTSLIFGIIPIVRAAKIHPLNIIREMPEGDPEENSTLITGLILLIGVLFCILTIITLHDIYLGIQTVLISFAVLTVLEVSFVGIARAMSYIPVPERFNSRYLMMIVLCGVPATFLLFFLPVFGVSLMLLTLLGLLLTMQPPSWKISVKLALRNVARHGTRSATIMLALFIGVFAVGLILVLGLDFRNQLEQSISNDMHYNVLALTTADEAKAVQVKQASVPGLRTLKQLVYTQTVPLMINGKTLLSLIQSNPSMSRSQLDQEFGYLSSAEGYNVMDRQFPEVQIVSGRNLDASDAGADHVLIPSILTQPYSLAMKVGDTISLSSVDGKATRAVTIIGVYAATSTDFFSNVPPIKTTAETARALSRVGQEMALFYMQIDPQKVSQAEVVFGNLAPDGYIVDVTDLGNTIDPYLSDFLLILATIASFSLLAGIIIIANAVALAMLERRREIGILKSVGYTSGTVLRQVLIEYGVVGGMSALLASLLIAGALAFIGRFMLGGISLGVSVLPVLLLIVGAVLLTMVTALLMSWVSVHVRPLEVLRYE